jgi:hypothetical protein
VTMRERARLGALGAAGVALTHCFAYYLSLEELPGHAAMHHAPSGHSFWPAVITAALLLSVVTVASSIVSPPSGGPLTSRVFVRLAVLQCSSWVALLVAERVVSGHDLTALLGEPVLWIGLGLQLIAAFAGAILFRAATSLARALRTRIGAPARHAPDTSPPPERDVRPSHLRFGSTGRTLRGPPVAAGA